MRPVALLGAAVGHHLPTVDGGQQLHQLLHLLFHVTGLQGGSGAESQEVFPVVVLQEGVTDAY